MCAYNSDLNECNNEQSCENGATCVNFYGGYSCECHAGFTGARCENGIRVLMYLNVSIKLLSNLPFRYYCKSIVDINECGRDPCFNNATCINTVGSFECDCTPELFGELCEQGILEQNT